LVGLAVCCVAGTWAGQAFVLPSGVLIGLAAGSWLVSLVCAVRAKAGPAGQLPGPPDYRGSLAALGCAAILACASAELHASRSRGRWLPPRGTAVELTGIVAGDPEVWPAGGSFAWRFPLRVDAMVYGTNVVSVGDEVVRVRLHGSGARHGPAYGERWSVAGTVAGSGRRSSRAVAASDRDKYVRSGLRQAQRLSAGHGVPAAEMCYSARRKAAGYLALGIEDRPDVVGLVRALLLGYRGQLPPSVREIAVASGTLHIFAISGLHVGVIAGLLMFVLCAFRVSRVYWVLFIAPLLAAYTLATGMRSSAMRACVMAVIYYAAPFAGRKPDSLSAVAMAAIAILVVAPSQLFNIGFVYSFVVVIGLIVLFPPFYAPWHRVLAPDPFRLEKEKWLARRLRGAGRYMASLWALSCAAWLTSVPLTAHYFGGFAAGTVLANLGVIPLTFLMVLSGCLSLLLGPCIPFLAHVFNHANVGLVTLLLGFLSPLTTIPGAHVRITKPPVWAVLLWYLLLGCVVLWWRKRRAGRMDDFPAH